MSNSQKLFNFLGETFDADWESCVRAELLVDFVPEPYWFCFNGGYTWTCTTIADGPPPMPPLQPKLKPAFCSSTKKDPEMRQCRLNGKASLKLNEDLGEKMRPLDSRTVFIDVKVHIL